MDFFPSPLCHLMIIFDTASDYQLYPLSIAMSFDPEFGLRRINSSC